MRMEKINENQIRFIISSQDLEERNLSLKNLKYGSLETKKLFQDMLRQATDTYNFNNEELPLMVEAIPVSFDELLVIISVVEDADELDPHFARFTSKEQQPFETPEGPVENFITPENAPSSEVFIMKLNTLDDVIYLSKNIDFFPGSSHLYKPEENGPFYLVFNKPEIMTEKDFMQFLNSIREFGELIPESAALYGYFHEHLKPVMENPLYILNIMDI